MLKNEVLRRSDDVKKNIAAADYYKKYAKFDNIGALKDKSDGELRALLGRMVSEPFDCVKLCFKPLTISAEIISLWYYASPANNGR